MAQDTQIITWHKKQKQKNKTKQKNTKQNKQKNRVQCKKKKKKTGLKQKHVQNLDFYLDSFDSPKMVNGSQNPKHNFN